MSGSRLCEYAPSVAEHANRQAISNTRCFLSVSGTGKTVLYPRRTAAAFLRRRRVEGALWFLTHRRRAATSMELRHLVGHLVGAPTFPRWGKAKPQNLCSFNTEKPRELGADLQENQSEGFGTHSKEP